MTTCTTPSFDSKDPGERVLIAFDFGRNFAAVSAVPAPVVTVARLSGAADADPSLMMDGAPTISGARVMQWVVGGVDGARYLFGCQAEDADGWVLVEAGTLTVRKVLP